MIPRALTSLIRPIGLLTLGLFCASTSQARPIIIGPTGILGYPHPKWPHEAVAMRVDQCEKGSPADGKLKPGDLIVGIGNEKFTESPFSAFPAAVDDAEAKGGKLTLLLESGEQVTLQLADLGAYGPTAPYHCPKTDALIEQAARQLMQEKGLGSSPTRSGLLGLMATGDKKHLEVVAEIIRNSDLLKIDPQVVDQYLTTGQPDLGSTGWLWGYNCIALGEYYLLTKDEAVLPALRTYALGLARGQDAVGLWGHRMATDARMRRAPGYGIMNQCSMSNFMGMLLARKCGIQDPILDKAIETTNAYVADHINRGGFPYGVHGPSDDQFNNNGTSGSAAICMALMGNREGASYFSKVSIPTHNKLTLGHASHFFNPLWTPLGASLSGPEVTQKFFKRSLWYFNGKRHWSGGFPGKDNGGYFAGQALLTYCLPRKVLYITGREADESIWITGKEVDHLIEMNLVESKARSNEELFEMLRHPIIQERTKAAREMSDRLTFTWGRKLGEDPFSPTLLTHIKSGNEQEKIMALRVLGGIFRGYSAHFAATFAEVLKNGQESLAVRVEAASAFRNCGVAAFPHYNDILRLVLEQRTEVDPFGHIDKQLARALDAIPQNLKPEEKAQLNPDKDLVYRVAHKLLEHPRQDVRAVGIKLLEGIPLEDFHLVGEKLMHVLRNKDPGYHSYSSILNADGIEILAGLNIKEGLDLLEDGIFHGDGKWGFKYSALIKSLPRYGANAKPYIERFEAHGDINKPGDRFTPAWQKAVEAIRKDTTPKKLITVEEAIRISKTQSSHAE